MSSSQLQQWNLRFIEQTEKLSETSFKSEVGLVAFEKLINDYPSQTTKSVFFVGNGFYGNLAFNFLIHSLLESDKIQSRANRINILDFTNEESQYSEIVFIDNLELNLLSSYQMISLINLVENKYYNSNLIILNIPSESMIKLLPSSLQSLMRESINIGFRGE